MSNYYNCAAYMILFLALGGDVEVIELTCITVDAWDGHFAPKP